MKNSDAFIDRWRTGEQAAAELIYNHHRERTFRLAYGLLGNTEDAEEAAQDALGYALSNIHHFDERRSKFTTWLHMITVSRSRDIMRKRRLPTFSLTTWLARGKNPEDPRPGPEKKIERVESHNQVWLEVQQLSPLLREAVVLRYWGGHTYQEIADIVGCPMKTAQSRVRLAHKKLTNSLASFDLNQVTEETP